jgi:hypothetical protein
MDEEYFFCTVCAQWFSLSGSSGNALKHVRTRHPDQIGDPHPVDTDEDRINTIADVVDLFLGHDLPFALAEDPLFRRMTKAHFTRQAISAEIPRIRRRLDEQVADELACAAHVYLTCDEWTDCGQNRFFGIQALAVSSNGYKSFSLAHWPMAPEQGTAKGLSGVMTAVLKRFFPKGHEKIEFIITDTTNVMPAMVNLLRKKWMRCWAHVMNLVLHEILQRVIPVLQPILDLVRLTSASSRWAKFVENGKYATLPTYSSTRWFSMYRLIHNALELKDEIMDFIDEQMSLGNRNAKQVPEETWHAAEVLNPILETFHYCGELMEKDKFGTLGHVIEVELLMRKAIASRFRSLMESGNCHLREDQIPEELPEDIRLGPLMEGIKNGWIAGRKKWAERLTGGVREIVLINVMLNPSIDPSILSREDSVTAEKVLRAKFDSNKRSDEPVGRLATRVHTEGFTRADLTHRMTERDEWSEFQRIVRLDQKVDVHTWWERNKDTFPTFYQLAQRYLVIPATSASSERRFSKAKRLKPKQRWALKPLKLSAMVVTAENRDLFDETAERRTTSGESSLPTDRSPYVSETDSD